MRHTRLFMALAAAPLLAIACDNNNATRPGTADVAVTAAGFSPPRLVVEPADSIAGGEGTGTVTVDWAFTDGPHNITFEAGGSSGTLPAGSTFAREFTGDQPSTYRYRCTLHSTDFLTGEVGEIVVF